MRSHVFAHSLAGFNEDHWERLSEHLEATAALSGRHASAFGWERVGELLGRLHDIGKVSDLFQSYIRTVGDRGGSTTGGDHSTAGARVAARRYGSLGRSLAFGIAGHHAGLPDADDLDRRLDPERTAIPSYDGWEAHAGALPNLAALRPSRPLRNNPRHRGFAGAFRVRMLFSCLVDADFLCTEAFLARAEGLPVERGGHAGIAELRDRLLARRPPTAARPTPLNAIRDEIRDHAVGKASLPPGAFTLSVPTGGGKTLTSLSFALEHAVRHGLRRVVYVIPYTSIIEQTASVFREALGTETDVLEHHASFDWEGGRRQGAAAGEDGQGRDGLSALRRAAENWDVPIVVTTAVQFFESLFAARTSRCRKLHNLAGSVVVLDEAQSLPLHLLRPCLAALDELCLNYGASVVLCTATQPAVRRGPDGFADGLDLPDERELAPDPPALHRRLVRQRVELLSGETEDATIAARFAERPQMLCIVNSRRHAWELFGRIGELPGAVHLSTFQCPRHRGVVLADIRHQLRAGEPVRLVATSLVEAGVDISFPEVWRAEAGLDSIAQAAGRCNREGELLPALGRVVVFAPAGHAAARESRLPGACAREVMRRTDDPLSPDAIRSYFRALYWNRGSEAFDAARLDGKTFPILAGIAETASGERFEFDRIARAFRMIDEAMEPIVVPWQEDGDDREAATLLKRIEEAERPGRSELRALQRYVVPVPSATRARWLANGWVRPVHPSLGDTLSWLAEPSLYRPDTGLRVFDADERSALDNLF